MNAQEGSGVMRVKTELVLEQLVSRVIGRALELRSAELDPASEAVLAEAPEPQALARLGYASRRAEAEMFEPARNSMPWLEEKLREGSGSADIAEIARELAADEPDEKPAPGEGSWRVPGPGGHVRHYLALAAADEVVHGDSNGTPPASRELSAGEAKRCFLYGFYARCCEEVSPTTSADDSLRD
ncbi:MAG TPA: hypothetical protein VLB79_05865 [Solirubrobacterales bacterium]|nr:hypothetical protein [Solirubrobacterales bacterium]